MGRKGKRKKLVRSNQLTAAETAFILLSATTKTATATTTTSLRNWKTKTHTQTQTQITGEMMHIDCVIGEGLQIIKRRIKQGAKEQN